MSSFYTPAFEYWPNDLLAPYDPRFVSNLSALTANDARGTRVIARKSGRIRDLTIFVGTSSGNIDLGIYDTVATTRTKLYSSGSTACGTGNAWQTVTADTGVDVKAGDHLDLALACDNATATFGRAAAFANAAVVDLPSNYWTAPNGGANFMNWVKATAFALPSTIAESGFTTATTFPFIMARIA